MHRRGRDHARIDQRLGAFLALDQDHLRGIGDARLVVERPRIGGGIVLRRRASQGAELLFRAGRVVAIDDRDQLARGIEVVPLRCRRPQFIDRRFLA